MKPYDNFDDKINSWYCFIIPFDDDPKTSWTCWHLFRPYNANIFKVGMKSKYWFRNYWRNSNLREV